MENRAQQQGQGAGAAQNHYACASCKHQRKRCNQQCELAPYFPVSRYPEYQNAHKIFGVSNIYKIMTMVQPEHRQAAAETLLAEGNARRNDPVHGCLGICRNLLAQVEFYEKQLAIVNQHLAVYKEKEKLDGQQNQSKEAEDLQHDQSNCLNFPAPVLPDLAPEVMAEMKKYEYGYIYRSNLEDAEEKPFGIQLIEPAFESIEDGNALACFSGVGESSAAASKALEKQPLECLQEKNTEEEAEPSRTDMEWDAHQD